MQTLKGKVVVITGANTGIGFATAKEMCKCGATVILGCRTGSSAEIAAEKIRDEYPAADVRFIRSLDVGSFVSIQNFAAAFMKLDLPLHILVNNAGLAMPEFSEAACGHEVHIATHFLGPLMLTMALEQKLNTTPNSRVVFVASSAHLRTRYSLQPVRQLLALRGVKGRSTFEADWLAIYGLSKLCTVYMAQQLSAHFRDINPTAPCRVVAVHPGLCFTGLFRHLWSWWLRWPLYYISLLMFKTPTEAAQTILHAATHPTINSGSYYVDCRDHGVASRCCCLSFWALDQEQSTVVYQWGLKQLQEAVAGGSQ